MIVYWQNPKNDLGIHENGNPKSEIPSGDDSIPQMEHTSCSVHLCLYVSMTTFTVPVFL